jgi:hypothetical protein
MMLVAMGFASFVLLDDEAAIGQMNGVGARQIEDASRASAVA